MKRDLKKQQSGATCDLKLEACFGIAYDLGDIQGNLNVDLLLGSAEDFKTIFLTENIIVVIQGNALFF